MDYFCTMIERDLLVGRYNRALSLQICNEIRAGGDIVGYWWLPKIKDFPIVFYAESQLLTKSCPNVGSFRGTKMVPSSSPTSVGCIESLSEYSLPLLLLLTTQLQKINVMMIIDIPVITIYINVLTLIFISYRQVS